MILSFLWLFLAGGALVFGLFSGTAGGLAAAAMEGAQQGVTLAISMAGALCLWCGLAKVMEAAGITALLAKLFRPLLRLLFPESSGDPAICGKLSENITANLLGLGNAATPAGIAAVRGMRAASGGTAATDEMCRLIVLNTASIQLLPTTVAAARSALGCAHAFDVLPAVWGTSLVSASAGVAAAALLGRLCRG